MASLDHDQDIPYGDDWHNSAAVAAWAEAAERKRPWRSRFRETIAEAVTSLGPGVRILELGSGPGFLAEQVLMRCPKLANYTLLDFSEPMLTLSRERLARFDAASFVLADFKSADWSAKLAGPFDAVVSMQAVHELRQKRHALGLYRQVHQITAAGGSVRICDHTPFDDSPRSRALYLTEQEQMRALSAGGFAEVRIVLAIGGLVLYACEKAGQRSTGTSSNQAPRASRGCRTC